MSDNKKSIKDIFNLSFYVRLGVIVVVILLAVFLYCFGKQHTVYIDNRTMEIDGVSYRALDWAEVSIDGMDAAEYSPRTRREATVMRQKHTIHVIYEDEDFNQFEVEGEFSIPLNETRVVLSLPAFVAGLGEDKFITEFIPMAQLLGLSTGQESSAEEQITEEEMFGDITMDF